VSQLYLFPFDDHLNQLFLVSQCLPNLVSRVPFHYFLFDYGLIHLILNLSSIETRIIFIFILNTVVHLHLIHHLHLGFYIFLISSNVQVQLHILLHNLITKTVVAVASTQASWTPSFIIENLAIELVSYAIEAIIFFAFDKVRGHILASEVLLGVEGVIRTI
jgi:hypothetical protein